MTCKESEEKHFTFLWKLENISYSLQQIGEVIKSPVFLVDAIEQTKWRLHLFPRGETEGTWLGCNLHREADSKGEDKVEIKYELAFIAKDGSVLISSGVFKEVFPKGKSGYFSRFVKREDVFVLRRSEFLPQDTMTVRCRFWKVVGEMTEDIRCTSRTRIGIERRSFLWDVKNFSTLQSEKKFTYQIKSIGNEASLMSVDLLLIGGLNFEEIIRFELLHLNQTIKFSTLRLFLIDSSGYKVECNREEIWFEDPVQCKQFRFFFTRKRLLEKESIYLPNDTLSLLWEWTFSKGILFEEIEEVQNGCTYPEMKISFAHNVKDEKTADLNVLVDNVKSLYEEHFLSDVNLKTNTNVFPAHKFMLSAFSSVFKTMFSSGMKEQISNCINIEDMSDETIRRMLFFVYTKRVEELTWESASDLYAAADKYAILSLKDICSSYLKDNLSPNNACKALLLADFHADGGLKSAVQDYILKHVKDIVNSNEWKILMETNAKLAAETVCLFFN
ncbi:TD and POZ domain-containing protein 5 [Argiope bruennichi]|uniref:TD and POZ domain-containing protein 5 n=1 Tax=Argiope bruennichi TaxID=94029 RepID=A0A8T0EF94_ARGBR|nr:TD and POZ domain-containing protein 5 [Argiope bruennichi]